MAYSLYIRTNYWYEINSPRSEEIFVKRSIITKLGWLTAAFLGGYILFSPQTVPQEQINLIDPAYPLVTAGEAGWDLVETASADLNADDRPEKVIVMARVERDPKRPREFMWDDGQPWQIYIEDEQGERSYIYSRYVQLGRLEVVIGHQKEDGPRSIILLELAGAGIAAYRINYNSPGQYSVEKLFKEIVDTRPSLVLNGP